MSNREKLKYVVSCLVPVALLMAAIHYGAVYNLISFIQFVFRYFLCIAITGGVVYAATTGNHWFSLWLKNRPSILQDVITLLLVIVVFFATDIFVGVSLLGASMSEDSNEWLYLRR